MSGIPRLSKARSIILIILNSFSDAVKPYTLRNTLSPVQATPRNPHASLHSYFIHTYIQAHSAHTHTSATTYAGALLTQPGESARKSSRSRKRFPSPAKRRGPSAKPSAHAREPGSIAALATLARTVSIELSSRNTEPTDTHARVRPPARSTQPVRNRSARLAFAFRGPVRLNEIHTRLHAARSKKRRSPITHTHNDIPMIYQVQAVAES